MLALAPDGGVTLAGLADSDGAIGVYATEPGLLGGGPSGGGFSNTRVPVAMAGIVPVKVTNENGPIYPGDLLAVSRTKPGYAARAKPACRSADASSPSTPTYARQRYPRRRTCSAPMRPMAWLSTFTA